MALVPSGEIAIKDNTLQAGSTSIALEVDGNTTGDKHLATLGTSAGVSAGGTSMSEFYGYTSIIYGRMYGESQNFVQDYYIFRTLEGSYYFVPTLQAEALEFSADRNESTGMYKDNSGTAFILGDNVDGTIFRRTKNTSNTWTTVTTYTPYTSQTYSCDFSTYDYKWILYGGS